VIPDTLLAKSAMGEQGLPAFVIPDTVGLPAAVTLHLAAGKADWLSGRCVCGSLPPH
jgi:hypothetical protein